MTSCDLQASALLAAVAGVPLNAAQLIVDANDKPMDRIFGNLDAVRAKYVEIEEKNITHRYLPHKQRSDLGGC